MAAGLDGLSSLIATEEHGQALRVHWKKEAGAPLLVRWCVIRCRDKCLRNGAFQGLSCVTGAGLVPRFHPIIWLTWRRPQLVSG